MAEGQHARDYLAQRGLSREVQQAFGIGYAPDGWEALKRHLSARGVAEAVQVEYGLLVQREESGRTYDRFRDRVMFPIRDVRERTIAFGGRVLGDAKPKYLNSPETPVFHKGRELYGLYEARQAEPRLERLLIVEGYMDVVALAQFGIRNAVATLGTSTSEEHLVRLFRLVSEVVFCFDGDRAGRQAAARALETVLPLMIDGRQARFLFLPEGRTRIRWSGARELRPLSIASLVRARCRNSCSTRRRRVAIWPVSKTASAMPARCWEPWASCRRACSSRCCSASWRDVPESSRRASKPC